MAEYVRIGNRTFTSEQVKSLTPKQVAEIKVQAEKANQKRLDNMRQSMGLEPQKVTLDVTPRGIAARKAAIDAEEARIAAETKAIDKDLGEAGPAGFVKEAEAPAEVKVKKPLKKKATETASSNLTT
jgi:hypothetical protein